MGLNISLHHYTEPVEKVIAAEDLANEWSKAKWDAAGEYDKLTKEQKDAIRAEIEEEFTARNLDKGGQSNARKEIVEPWPEDPDHLCKIGYLRSSYNSGGFNSVAGQVTGRDWYWAFDTDGETYVVQPNWGLARDRCLILAEEISKAEYRARTISAYHSFKGPQARDDEEALELFVKEKMKGEEDGWGNWYSTADLDMFGDEGLKVLCAVQGTDVLGRPALHLIHEWPEDSREWYVKAAKIAAANCQFVIDQPDPERYRLHWGG